MKIIFPFLNNNGPLLHTLSQEIEVGNERTNERMDERPDEVTSALLELLSQLKMFKLYEYFQFFQYFGRETYLRAVNRKVRRAVERDEDV